MLLTGLLLTGMLLTGTVKPVTYGRTWLPTGAVA